MRADDGLLAQRAVGLAPPNISADGLARRVEASAEIDRPWPLTRKACWPAGRGISGDTSPGRGSTAFRKPP